MKADRGREWANSIKLNKRMDIEFIKQFAEVSIFFLIILGAAYILIVKSIIPHGLALRFPCKDGFGKPLVSQGVAKYAKDDILIVCQNI